MTIITAPHPTLRQQATPITQLDQSINHLIADLKKTLLNTHKPKGVGLAAPQINTAQRIFVTNFPETDAAAPRLRVFINPALTDHSDQTTFGPDAKEPLLEGCLSLPGIWGPVPRFERVVLTFDEITDSGQL